ncbi:MAG: MarR family winged helix-turn-helix transcriptional regulator [Gaiellaceae bacterium]
MGVASSAERAAHLVGAFLDPVIGELGITQGEAHVLARLAVDGKATIGALHDEFGHKRSTLTNIVDRLEGRGFVRREINREDRRSFLIELTGSGRRAATRVTAALDRLERELLVHVSVRDLKGFGATVLALDGVVERSRGAAEASRAGGGSASDRP